MEPPVIDPEERREERRETLKGIAALPFGIVAAIAGFGCIGFLLSGQIGPAVGAAIVFGICGAVINGISPRQ